MKAHRAAKGNHSAHFCWLRHIAKDRIYIYILCIVIVWKFMGQLRKILCVFFACNILQMIRVYLTLYIIHCACMKAQGGQFMENLLRLLYGLQRIVNEE